MAFKLVSGAAHGNVPYNSMLHGAEGRCDAKTPRVHPRGGTCPFSRHVPSKIELCWQFSILLRFSSLFTRSVAIKKENLTPTHSQNTSMSSRKCSLCGQPGHYRSTCPKKSEITPISTDSEQEFAAANPPHANTETFITTGRGTKS